MDLFSKSTAETHEPLAARMRPRNLDEYIGQDHIVGPGRLLRRAIQADQLTSVIFYGPPGTGKTTLARVIANHTKSNFVTLNAVLAGVQQIRDSIAVAEDHRKLYNRRTILFVDEVHRWNRAQQDALLPWVENGTIILIGATTENPFFEVNKALVSRSRVFQLKALTETDLKKAAMAAIADTERGYGRWNVTFTEGALEHLVATASGDARSILNALELAIESSVPSWPPENGTSIAIDMKTAEESIQQKVVLYDRDGDYHYDVISAFIKSLRGRDPDAAMYWLARMIAAGEDPGFIFRRMLISSCEDTGLADPMAITVVESCAAAFDRVGLPEGRYHLAHAALYLATAPKSNSSMAFFDALASVEKEDTEVPNHLRDGNRDADGFGHGQGYIYPHTYREHWAAQQYLPDQLVGRVFYTPSAQGYEGQIREEVLTRRELQIAAIMEEQNDQKGELLTFSPGGKGRDAWTKRLDSGKSETLLRIRNALAERAAILRHERVLVWGADDGLLVWEAGRRAPEGYTVGLCRSEEGKSILEQYASSLDELDRPHLMVMEGNAEKVIQIKDAGGNTIPFDCVLARESASTQEELCRIAESIRDLCAPLARFVFCARVPSRGMRLSQLLSDNDELRNEAAEAEKALYENADNPIFSWNERSLSALLGERGMPNASSAELCAELRRLTREDLDRWFDAESSPYGKALLSGLGPVKTGLFRNALESEIRKGPCMWKYEICFVTVAYPLIKSER